jgi:hypothetical protein
MRRRVHPDAGSRRAAALIVTNNPADASVVVPELHKHPSASGRVSRRLNDTAIVRIAVDGELP